jgi:hypothetical protein
MFPFPLAAPDLISPRVKNNRADTAGPRVNRHKIFTGHTFYCIRDKPDCQAKNIRCQEFLIQPQIITDNSDFWFKIRAFVRSVRAYFETGIAGFGKASIDKQKNIHYNTY